MSRHEKDPVERAIIEAIHLGLTGLIEGFIKIMCENKLKIINTPIADSRITSNHTEIVEYVIPRKAVEVAEKAYQ